jgi:hypothetical protein
MLCGLSLLPSCAIPEAAPKPATHSVGRDGGDQASTRPLAPARSLSTPVKTEPVEPVKPASPDLIEIAVDGPIEVQETNRPDGRPKSRVEGRRDVNGAFVSHGLTSFWYQSGQKKSETRYANGTLHGPRTNWYAGGQVWSEGRYVDGLEDGVWVKYYENGGRQSQWHMRLGAWHGPYTEWYPNGQKRLEVEFVDGQRQGLQTTWNDQGVVELQGDYVDGVEQP